MTNKPSPLMLLLIIWPASVLADDTPQYLKLRHDPFAKPSMLSATKSGAKKPITPKQSMQNQQLLGVLMAGGNSMVNIGGTIVQINEKFAGYRLIEVFESSAVLEKNGEQLILKIDHEKTWPELNL